MQKPKFESLSLDRSEFRELRVQKSSISGEYQFMRAKAQENKVEEGQSSGWSAIRERSKFKTV